MTAASVARKLGLKPGGRLRVLLAPPDIAALLGVLPEGAAVSGEGSGPCALLLLFARDSTQLVRHLPLAQAALEPLGTLWVAFIKRTSGQTTDVNRDLIRDHAMTRGLRAAGIIAIDARWSALALKSV